MKTALLIAVCVLGLTGQATAHQAVKVDSVIDGDTFKATVEVWPKTFVRATVRALGIDTPEIRGKCEEEKKLAIAAKEHAEFILGKAVFLWNIKFGKYAGRVIAEVQLEDLTPFSERMIQAGFARRYHGGPRSGWCDGKR